MIYFIISEPYLVRKISLLIERVNNVNLGDGVNLEQLNLLQVENI